MSGDVGPAPVPGPGIISQPQSAADLSSAEQRPFLGPKGPEERSDEHCVKHDAQTHVSEELQVISHSAASAALAAEAKHDNVHKARSGSA